MNIPFLSKPIPVEESDIKNIIKRQSLIEETINSLTKSINNLRDDINRIDQDLSILNNFHLNHMKMNADLETNTEQMNKLTEEVEKNTKETIAAKEDVIDHIDEVISKAGDK